MYQTKMSISLTTLNWYLRVLFLDIAASLRTDYYLISGYFFISKMVNYIIKFAVAFGQKLLQFYKQQIHKIGEISKLQQICIVIINSI